MMSGNLFKETNKLKKEVNKRELNFHGGPKV